MRTTRPIFRRARSHLLAILGAAITGNLLFTLTGGFAPVGLASASAPAQGDAPAIVSDMTFTLKPSDPSRMVGVSFAATLADGSTPSRVVVEVETDTLSRAACSPSADGSVWTCRLPGLSNRQAERIQVLAQ